MNAVEIELVGGVLQRNNIHLKVCELGEVGATLTALRKSSATTNTRRSLFWRPMVWTLRRKIWWMGRRSPVHIAILNEL